MKIIIAPDSFKGSLSAIEVCDIIEASIYEMKNEAILLEKQVENLMKFGLSCGIKS